MQLAAGGAHVCVRIDDGTARCWGRNDVGQLGLGVGGEPRTAPAQVVGLRNIEEIRAGIFHTCARLASGEVHCWGGKIDGVALGFDLDPASRLRITRIVGGATRLVVGHERTYARTRTGWVTWAPQRGPAPAARATPDLDEAVEIASGWSDECALGKQGEVTCWGASHASSFPRRHEPEAAMLVPNLPAALRVSVGRAHACALVVGGAVHCWREIHGYRPALPSPEKVAGVADAVDLTSGFDFSCARTRDGRVRCWGRTESLPADSSLGE